MISPGCGGLNIIIFLLVIIRDFRIVRISILPNEAFAVAIVYSNTVLAGAVVPQGLQGIARRTYIVETPGRVKLEQLARSFRSSGAFCFSCPRRSSRCPHRETYELPLYCISVNGKRRRFTPCRALNRFGGVSALPTTP